MISLQRLLVSALLILSVTFVFFAQSAEASKGPKITHKVRLKLNSMHFPECSEKTGGCVVLWTPQLKRPCELHWLQVSRFNQAQLELQPNSDQPSFGFSKNTD